MIGFIGAGNMATALIQGMIDGGVPPSSLMAFDISKERVKQMRALSVEVAGSIPELADASDFVVLAVKPKDYDEVLRTLNGRPKAVKLLSIAVGYSQAMLQKALPNAEGIARMMPNTPSLVREGVLAFNTNHTMAEGDFSQLLEAMSACGRTVVIPENLFDAVTGISGSGPAYVYLFIEALADAGVMLGLPRDMSYTLAGQTLLGAAKMVLDTGKHPGELKDAVCSPGGTTIEAVYTLEKAGLRSAVMQAVEACAKKAAQMTKP